MTRSGRSRSQARSGTDDYRNGNGEREICRAAWPRFRNRAAAQMFLETSSYNRKCHVYSNWRCIRGYACPKKECRSTIDFLPQSRNCSKLRPDGRVGARPICSRLYCSISVEPTNRNRYREAKYREPVEFVVLTFAIAILPIRTSSLLNDRVCDVDRAGVRMTSLSGELCAHEHRFCFAAHFEAYVRFCGNDFYACILHWEIRAAILSHSKNSAERLRHLRT